jgi:hypothetical protein
MAWTWTSDDGVEYDTYIASGEPYDDIYFEVGPVSEGTMFILYEDPADRRRHLVDFMSRADGKPWTIPYTTLRQLLDMASKGLLDMGPKMED